MGVSSPALLGALGTLLSPFLSFLICEMGLAGRGSGGSTMLEQGFSPYPLRELSPTAPRVVSTHHSPRRSLGATVSGLGFSPGAEGAAGRQCLCGSVLAGP